MPEEYLCLAASGAAYRVFQTLAERPDLFMSRSLRHQSTGGSGGELEHLRRQRHHVSRQHYS